MSDVKAKSPKRTKFDLQRSPRLLTSYFYGGVERGRMRREEKEGKGREEEEDGRRKGMEGACENEAKPRTRDVASSPLFIVMCNSPLTAKISWTCLIC